jgi:cytochrome c-type biogenesis protein CcmH
MKRLLATLLFVLALAALSPAHAQAGPQSQAPIEFRDAAEEKRFRALTSELRCVMCQNQSLADSDAMIAHDLRAQILRMIRDGRTDAQIKDFLVARYTDFVLYKPRVTPSTWLLWFGPAVILLAGAVVIAVIVRRKSRTAPGVAPGDDEQEW